MIPFSVIEDLVCGWLRELGFNNDVIIYHKDMIYNFTFNEDFKIQKNDSILIDCSKKSK